MREFFGFGGYTRQAEGFLSWQHLTFVTAIMAVMVGLAVFLGKRNRNGTDRQKNKVLIAAALLIDGFELFKIVLMCFRSRDPMLWLYELPLFLCSIQLLVIPLAAFSKGRLREASLDFVMVFGILGAVLGTYGAGNNYASYPVLGFDNVVSGITHGISGFCSLYIGICGMRSMKKRNIPLVCGILTAFCVMAYTANILLDYNYMFLMRGDGTPYEIFYGLVNGSRIFYPMVVIGMFFLYILVFYLIHAMVQKARLRRKRAFCYAKKFSTSCARRSGQSTMGL